MLEIKQPQIAATTFPEDSTQVRPLPSALKRFRIYISKNWVLFLLAAPALIILFLMHELPMFGAIIAFQDYTPKTGFFSPWVGFKNFAVLFNSPSTVRIFSNTLILNTIFLTTGTFVSVIVALLLNEVGIKWFRRLSQSLMYLPFFMSWPIVALLFYSLTDYNFGTVNVLMDMLGLSRISINSDPAPWPWILNLITVWKGVGAGCIVYLAVLTGVDTQLYEAAIVDGADRWERMRYISLPALTPMIIVLTLMSIGNIFKNDFGMFYAIIGSKAMLYPTTDVIETYIFRSLQNNTDLGVMTAVGLTQAVFGCVTLVIANWFVRIYSRRQAEDYALF